MKNIIRIAAIAIAACPLCGCKFIKINPAALDISANEVFESILSGETVSADGSPVQTINNTVSGFTRLVMDGAFDVEYSTGDPALRISAPEKILGHLVVKEEDGVLNITTDGTKIRNWGDVEVRLSAPVLRSIEVNGAVDFDADYLVCDGGFSMEINGAGDVEIDSIQAGDVKIVVNGAGDVELSGSAANVDIELNGAGDIDIRKLSCSGTVNSKKNGVGVIRR